MTGINIEVVDTLGSSLVPDSIYLVRGEVVQAFLTDNNGVASPIRNGSFINYIVDDNGGWKFAVGSIIIVPSIQERDNLALTAESNLLVAVSELDKKRLYAYEKSLDKWHDVSDMASADFVIGWDDLEERPQSEAFDIDDAVNKRHKHENMAVLDKISEGSNESLLYNGIPVDYSWTLMEW